MDQLHFANREAFRDWLERNHNSSNGFRMLFYKKHTKKANIPYDEAVEEALCFGWIDSLIKRINEDRYLRKFTPRSNIQKWSEINKIRTDKAYRQGRMTEFGLAKIPAVQQNGRLVWPSEKTELKNELNVPSFIRQALSENPPADLNFEKLAPSYRRNYLVWITSAKKEATRQKRLDEAISLLKQNKKLGMK